MNKKALLLIIPFAAAGLAGCERANPNPPGPTPDPQCESATVSIKSAGDVTTIKPTATLQLTAEVNISGCTFSWSSSDPTIATVDANGLVTGVKAGDVVISYGPGSFNLKVDDDAPTPPPTPVDDYGTEDKPLSVTQAVAVMQAECTQEDALTKQVIYCTGVVKEITKSGVYDPGDNYFQLVCTDNTTDVIVYRVHATDELKDSVQLGAQIKWVGYGKNFKGTLEFVDNGSTPCTLLSNGDVPVSPTLVLSKTKESVKVGADVTISATVRNTENAVQWSLLGDSGSFASITPNGNSVTIHGIAKGTAKVKAAIPEDNLEAVCEIEVKENVAPATVNVEYSFSALKKDDSNALDEAKALAAFTNGKTLGDDIVTAVAPTKSYSFDGALRVGTSGNAGSLAITTSANVTQVVVTARAYKDSELNTITIGSQTETVEVESTEFVYSVSSTKSITIDTSKRVLIEKIGFVAEGVEPEKELTNLSVKTQPSKTAYNEGESFDAAGLVLHAVYSDSSEEDITSGWTIAPSGALAPTDNKVVVSYGGKSVDVNITVTARELQSIVIDTQPTKVNYVEGESFDPAGMVVKANYNVGDPAVITNYTYSPNGALKLSDDKVVVSYNEKTATVDITVSEAPEVLASKFTFTAKDAFEESGKTGASMAASGTIQGFDTQNGRGVQWSKNAATVTISSFPEDYVINKIVVVGSSNNDTGPTFSVSVGGAAFGEPHTLAKENNTAMEFTGSASGSSIVVSATAGAASTYVLSVEVFWEKTEPAKPAVNSVTVSPKTANLDLTETTSVTLSATVNAVGGASEDVVWSIESGDDYVSLPETKTGASIVVTAAAKGTAVIKVASAVDPTKYDTCEVTVSETPAPEQVLDSIEVATAPSTTVYTEGQTFDKTGLTVTAHYTNGKADATIGAASLVCTPAGALSESDTLITISYTEGEITKTCTQAITVNKASGEKGTETNPYNMADLWTDICSKLTESGDWSDKSVYVTGVVRSIDDKTPSITIGDESSANTLLIYKPTSIDGVMVNDTILVHSYIEFYQNKYEMTGWNSYPTPVIDRITKGTVSVAVDSTSSANADVTLTGGATATNGSTYNFDVAAKSGYEIVSVKANGIDASLVSGSTYSITINGPTKIVVVTKEAGQADPELYEEVSLMPTNAGKATSSYTETGVLYEGTNIDLYTDNFNNNNKSTSWAGSKCGAKMSNSDTKPKVSTGYIYNKEAITEKINMVVLKVATLSTANVTYSCKLLVASNSSFTGATEYNFDIAAGDNIIAITPIASGFFKFAIEVTNGTTTNGPCCVSGVEFYH